MAFVDSEEEEELEVLDFEQGFAIRFGTDSGRNNATLASPDSDPDGEDDLSNCSDGLREFLLKDKLDAAAELKDICDLFCQANVPVSSLFVSNAGLLKEEYVFPMADLDAPQSSTSDSGIPGKVGFVREILDHFMGINVPIEKVCKQENILWILTLLSGGSSVEEFKAEVLKYDTSVSCGLVWDPNFVAYRCRTCSLSACMSLCAECFRLGNHEGHDFNMFRSQAGGACDCGDVNVLKESGFCSRHGPANQNNKFEPPDTFLSVAKYLIPKIIVRLFHDYRMGYTESCDLSIEQILENSRPIVKLLTELVNLGAVAHSVLTNILLNEKLYPISQKGQHHDDPLYSLQKAARSGYRRAVEFLGSICSKEEGEALECPQLYQRPRHKHLLDELIFWMVRLEYPQQLLTFIIALLPHHTYKDAVASSFAAHYSRTAALLLNQREQDFLSNRVVHLSVQLLSNESTALRLVDEHSFLLVLTLSHYLIFKKVISQTPHDYGPHRYFPVDCESSVIEKHNYWSITSDLHNVLGNTNISLRFMRDPMVVDTWCNLLSLFQGMNLNKRRLDGHVEHEGRAYYNAFSVELECCGTTMWHLLEKCKDELSQDCLLLVLQRVQSQLSEWFNTLKFIPDVCWKPPPYDLTFHLPLHRYYASFMAQAIAVGASLPFPSQLFLRQLVMHPLQIQISGEVWLFEVARAEISTKMWVRNGQTITYQAYLYGGEPHFCSSLIDADLTLLQLAASRVNPDWLVLTIFERFHLVRWLSFSPVQPGKPFLRPEWQQPMLEGALRLVANIVTHRLTIGMNEDDASRLEMATILASADRPYSQVNTNMPERGLRSNTTRTNFDQILEELADYEEPQMKLSGTLSQGTYKPKGIVWEKYFDPIFSIYRCLQMKDYQSSMDRFTKYVKRQGKQSMWNVGSLWPPYRLPKSQQLNETLRPLYRILSCRSFLAICYTILYRALNEGAAISEHSLQLTVYLLELAVTMSDTPAQEENQAEEAEEPGMHSVLDLHLLSTWFHSEDLGKNVSHRIDRVLAFDTLYGQTFTRTDYDLPDFPDLARLQIRYKTSQESEPLAVVLKTGSSTIPYIDNEAGTPDADINIWEAYWEALPPSVRRECLVYMHKPPLNTGRELGRELIHYPGPSNKLMVPYVTQRPPPDTTTSRRDMSVMCLPGQSNTDTHDDPVGIVEENSAEEEEEIEAMETDMPPSPPPPVRQRLPSAHPRLGILPPPSSDGRHALPPPEVYVTETGESIISLLIRIHNTLASNSPLGTAQRSEKRGGGAAADPCLGLATNYRPPSTLPDQQTTTDTDVSHKSRIGTGPFFIRKVLDKLWRGSTEGRREVEKVCGALNADKPPTSRSTEEGDKGQEEATKAEARKKGRERQRKLLAQFQQKQQAMMSQLLQAEKKAAKSSDTNPQKGATEESGKKDVEMEEKGEEEEMQCVICSQTGTESLVDDPFGLVSHCQANSVLGVQKSKIREARGAVGLELLTGRRASTRTDNRGWRNSNRFDRMLSSYEPTSTLRAMDIGFDGGVRVRTCGHYIHASCHVSYMQALQSDRMQSLTGRGEFYCPLCRQASNAFLPILPKSPRKCRESISHTSLPSLVDAELDMDTDDLELQTLAEDSSLKTSLTNFFKMCRVSTYQKFRTPLNDFENPAETSAFSRSLLRHNLETDVLLKNSRVHMAGQRSVIEPLVRIVRWEANQKEENRFWARRDWLKLAGKYDNSELSSVLTGQELVDPDRMDIPLLLVDPVTLFLRVVLLIHWEPEKQDIFREICRRIIALAVLQQFLATKRAPTPSTSPDAESQVGKSLMEIVTLQQADPSFGSSARMILLADTIVTAIVQVLDIAQCLQRAIFKSTVTTNDDQVAEVSSTVQRMSSLWSSVFGVFSPMTESGVMMDSKLNSLGELLKKESILQLISLFESWLEIPKSIDASLFCAVEWCAPCLKRLPVSYDDVVQKFFEMKCGECGTSPKEALLCLVCGDFLCFRGLCSCCQRAPVTELEMHTLECGAGTGVYLCVQSSMILLVRCRPCKWTSWGSLYLDIHGEEDKNLKRGKPLALSEARFGLLEKQWMTQQLDTGNRRWHAYSVNLGNEPPEIIAL